MRFTFINFSREPKTGEPFGVHRMGCADIGRTKANRGPDGTAANGTWDVDAVSPAAAVAGEIAAELGELGYDSPDWFKVYPCCTK